MGARTVASSANLAEPSIGITQGLQQKTSMGVTVVGSGICHLLYYRLFRIQSGNVLVRVSAPWDPTKIVSMAVQNTLERS